MDYKKIDELSISECCAELDIQSSQLPDILDNISGSQDIIDRLRSLLDADMSAFKSCSTIEQFEKYLELWIDGLHRSEASQRVAQLKAQAEELAFYKTNQNSISGLESYIKKYPNGRFIQEAKGSLANKKKARKIRNIILLVLLLIAAGIFAYCNYVPVSYVNVDDNAELNNLGSEISLGISTDAISSTITATSSEDWIDCRVSGKTLYISANINPKGERSATITITAHSSFFGNELSDRKQETITISQETGYASHLSVSNDDVNFSAVEGNESLTVNTDGIFTVSTLPASWITASVNGNTLNLDYTENSGTVRSSYLIISSGTKSKRIDITQAGKLATKLYVPSENLTFNANGICKEITTGIREIDGGYAFDVDTDGFLEINSYLGDWGTLHLTGNTILIYIKENPNSSTRFGYFIVKSGSIEKRVNILQDAKTATLLEASQTNIKISHTGGIRTITVECDDNWEIGVGTARWIDLSTSGNTITLEIEENPDIESRDDYFTIESGNLRKRITIEQSGNNKPRASIDRIWVDHNDYYNGYKGMRIHVDWNVTNCRNKTIYIVYEFYKSDNQTSINLHGISKSQLQYKLKPEYTETSYSDSWQFIPYASFYYLPSGDYSFDVVIKDDSGKTLVRNENNTFTWSR